MSDPKRKYNKIAPDHLAYAKRRFGEFASTSAVRAELKAMGGEYSHSQLHYYWHQANKGFGGKLARLTEIDQELASGE